MYNKKYLTLLAITGFAASLATTAPVLADTDNNNGFGRGFNQERRQSGIFGKVTAVNGMNITVTSSRDNKTYTVDASGATITKNGASSSVSGIAVGDMIMAQGPVTDTSVKATAIRDGAFGNPAQGNSRGIMGTVTVASVNGTTFTITGKTGLGAKNQSGTTTYAVDASSATVTKNGATSTVSSIAIGDTVMIKGTIDGTNIVATSINDGAPGKGKGLQSQTPIVNGDGQPMIAGSVSAINGSSISVTNKGNITYVIDSSSATIKKGGVDNATISNIAVGDNVVAQGAVTGTSMKASSVIDQGGAPTATTANSTGNNPETHPGFFGNIFNFFKHLFGF